MTDERIVPFPENPESPPRVEVKRGARHTFRALEHRNFRLYFYGQLVSLIGTWMQQTAMSWLVYQITNSKFLLGVVSAAGSAPVMFFSLWGGSLADRYPKRSILLITQTVSMFLAVILAAAVWLGRADPWFIVAIALLNGTALGFDMPTRQSFMAELVSRKDLMNAISLNSSAVNGARVVGPSVAGLLLGQVGAAACFLLNALSFLAVIAGLWKMQIPPRGASAQSRSAGGGEHALSGLRYVAHHPRVRTILILFAVVGIFGWSYTVLMPAYARDLLHLGASGYGVLMAANGTGALCGALSIAAYGDRFVPRRVALSGVGIFSAALATFASVHHFALGLIALWFAGFGMMLFFSTANTVLQTIVPDEMRGRVMGVWSLIFGAMVPLGSLEVGLLSPAIGVPATLIVGAGVCAMAALVTLWVVRRRDAQLAAQTGSAAPT